MVRVYYRRIGAGDFFGNPFANDGNLFWFDPMSVPHVGDSVWIIEENHTVMVQYPVMEVHHASAMVVIHLGEPHNTVSLN